MTNGLIPQPQVGGSYFVQFRARRTPAECRDVVQNLNAASREAMGCDFPRDEVVAYLGARREALKSQLLQKYLGDLRIVDIDGVLEVVIGEQEGEVVPDGGGLSESSIPSGEYEMPTEFITLGRFGGGTSGTGGNEPVPAALPTDMGSESVNAPRKKSKSAKSS